MARRHLLLGFAAAFIVYSCPGRALALEVVEAYRSILGYPRSVSVDPSDGSCWVGANSGIFHIAADGTILSHNGGFAEPHAVAANPTDGSCWVLEGSDCVGTINGQWPTMEGAVVHLDESGAELLRAPFSAGLWDCCPTGLAVNPADGSCWVGERPTGRLVHLAEDGNEIWRGHPFGARAISVNPTDGSCWVADASSNEVIHLAQDGAELWRGLSLDAPGPIAVNPADGSCWVAGALGATGDPLVHLAEDGTELLRVEGFDGALSISVNPADGSWWIADTANGAVVHLAEDGAELRRVGGFVSPLSVSVDPADGSCWVADENQVVHLSQEGAVLWQMQGLCWPSEVSVNSGDGSCWVGDSLGGWRGQVLHVAEDGAELWRDEVAAKVSSVAVDAGDGSCWVGKVTLPSYPYFYADDEYEGTVRRLGEDGGELWRGTEFAYPWSLSVNPTDGSCWLYDSHSAEDSSTVHLASDGSELWRTSEVRGRLSVNSADGSCWVGSSPLVHLAEDGTLLWRAPEPIGALSVSANSTDGSCWVSECSGAWVDGISPTTAGEITHLAEDGTELSRSQAGVWCAWVGVNATDGSCWVVAPCDGYVALLAEDGTELWRGESFVHPWCVSVNPTDGSCWVADSGTSQIVHLVVRRFGDVPGGFWAYDEIAACAGAGIVSGYEDGTYHPASEVDRAQMAVYIARAMAGGDDNVPEGPRPRSFVDVPRDHWAFDHIEYLKAAGVVTGYVFGTYSPDLPVTRDQIAVYVARGTGWVAIGEDMTGAPDLFPDVPAGHWAGAAIKECLDHGVVQGYDDGCYHPEIVVTRDQMAVYMARAFDL